MAMTTPIVSKVNAFDATSDHTFTFNVSGGNQVVKNRIKIINNDTSVEVYNNVVESFAFSQTVPSNKLTNGVYYAVAFKTYDVNGNESEWSSYTQFYCYTTPTISLNINDNQTIENATFDCILSYNQEQGELLYSAKIDLYDINSVLIKSSGDLYSSENPPLNINYVLEGLEDKKSYKIKASIITVNDTIVETNLIDFYVKYTNPILFSTLELTPYNCDGYIDIKSNIMSIDGEANPSSPIYIDSENVDCVSCDYDMSHINTSRWVKWCNGFNIPKSFLLRLWFTPSFIGKFISITSAKSDEYMDGYLYRNTNNDCIVIKTNSGTNITIDVNGHFNSTQKCFLWVKVIDNVWECKLEVLSQQNTIFNWNDNNNNIQYNMLSDIAYVDEDYEIYDATINSQKALSSSLDCVIISNGIYNQIDISSDTTMKYNTNYPSWNYYTILDCNFDNNINGGNLKIVLNQLTQIKIKRRTEDNLNWITIYEKDINTIEDLNINIKNIGVPSNLEQTYAIVPVLQGNIEGDYIIQKVKPNWQGTFIGDGEKVFKLYSAIAYDSTTQNKPIGLLSPIGTKYPIVIENSENDYQSGGLSAQLLGYNYEKTRKVDRNDVVKQADDFVKFMTNGKAKFLFDWNGNTILFRTMTAPTRSYNTAYSNGIISVAFTWVEQGKYNNEDDLRKNGLL